MDSPTEYRPFDVFAPDCPSRRAFDQIFSRWGILTLAKLTVEPIRFGALHRAIGGISEKMLSQTLKVLEEENMVLRQDWKETPPRVEYSLTSEGAAISQRLEGVITEIYTVLGHRFVQDTPLAREC